MAPKVILSGETVAESRVLADHLIVLHGYTLIHPYDDPIVITGQGTAGLEFIEDCPELDCLVVPIGGGGFISGVATAVKALRPATEIIGVEVESTPQPMPVCVDKSRNAVGQHLPKALPSRTPANGRCRSSATSSPISCSFRIGDRRGDLHPGKRAKDRCGGGERGRACCYLSDKARFAGRRVGIFQCEANQ